MELIPEPQQMKRRAGAWRLPAPGVLSVSEDLEAALELRAALPCLADWTLMRSAAGVREPGSILLCRDPAARTGAEGYRLRVDARGIEVRAQTERGVFYGIQTLLQILRQHPQRVPFLEIRDWPQFADRGVYYDVTRGRVPELARLFELIDRLAHYKINQLQLYIEHVFAFRKHPKIGRGASPLTSEDILRLDAYCRRRHIELVPSLQSFGHMSKVTLAPEYHHLCEDRGRLEYLEPPKNKQHRLRGWSLSPAVPGTYRFLDELYSEFLPLFSSSRFNACCDEVYDLGLGQSKRLCERRGKGRVYVDHLLRLRELAAKYGKRIMFWGDIVLKYPELLPSFPKDVTLLNWGYRENHKFETCHLFRKARLPFYGCPGTSSWVSLFPRIETSRANISKFAAMAAKSGAAGLLNTDWGDGGHYNFLEYSWYGFLFGAEQAWRPKADQGTFDRRFSTLFLGDPSGVLGRAVRDLGKVANHHSVGFYQSTLLHAFALPRGHKFFRQLKASTGTAFLKALERPCAILARWARASAASHDPAGVREYYLFAAATLRQAAKRIQAFGPGGQAGRARLRRLGAEHRRLRRRFEELWMARNRRSEIRTTLRIYDRVAKDYR